MKKINLKVLIIFMATVGLLIFLHLTGLLNPLGKYLEIALNPALAKMQNWSSGISFWYGETFRHGDLAAENHILQVRVEELSAANADMEKIKNENSQLRQHLKFLEGGTARKYVMANIVSREVFSGSGENRGDLVVDKGKDDGLVPALAVLNERGIVVGKITEVGEKVSTLALVTGTGCKFAAALQNGSRTIGVTSGNLGLTINMDFIPQSEKVDIGEMVVTSGLEPGIPAGLAIGRVNKINKDSNEIWQSANLEPLANLDDLTIVSVIVP
jgi:rod shape-determining protein MreC